MGDAVMRVGLHVGLDPRRCRVRRRGSVWGLSEQMWGAYAGLCLRSGTLSEQMWGACAGLWAHSGPCVGLTDAGSTGR